MLRLGCYLCVGRAGGSERDALRAEGVLTPPSTPSPGPGGGLREGLERPRWPKMASRGPQRAQDGLKDGYKTHPRLTKYFPKVQIFECQKPGFLGIISWTHWVFQDAPRTPRNAPRSPKTASKNNYSGILGQIVPPHFMPKQVCMHTHARYSTSKGRQHSGSARANVVWHYRTRVCGRCLWHNVHYGVPNSVTIVLTPRCCLDQGKTKLLMTQAIAESLFL